MCGGPSEEEQKKLQGGRGQCKSIENLLISENDITHLGIQSALRNLPYLKTVDHASLIQALADLQHNQEPLPKYGLISLKLTDIIPSPPYRHGSFELAASICPFVSNLELYINTISDLVTITDEELLGLFALKNLQKFTFHGIFFNGNESLITFNGGIVPLLKANGMSLHYLKIYTTLFSVDVALLIELCPNLLNLELYCRYVSTSQDEPPNPNRTKTDSFVLNRLETLEINGCHGSPIPSDNLVRLLCAVPTLASLVFEFCTSLTDDVIQKVFECHSFPCLRKLELKCCNFVTNKGIDLFMTEENALETIRIIHCPLVAQGRANQWKNKAKNNNWNCSIECYMYTF